jgi:hypothetical protein
MKSLTNQFTIARLPENRWLTCHLEEARAQRGSQAWLSEASQSTGLELDRFTVTSPGAAGHSRITVPVT